MRLSIGCKVKKSTVKRSFPETRLHATRMFVVDVSPVVTVVDVLVLLDVAIKGAAHVEAKLPTFPLFYFRIGILRTTAG